MKKILRIIITSAIAIALLLMSLQNMAVQAEDAVPAGYTPIYTVQDLYAISNAPEKNYILMNDIDLAETKPGGSLDSGNGWTPIRLFSGIFDGNGHYIMNMHIHGKFLPEGFNDEDYNYEDEHDDGYEYFLGGQCWIGLFSFLTEGSVVRNLGLTDVVIAPSTKCTGMGSIAGTSSGTIENCFATGTISGEIERCGDRGAQAGGISGYCTVGIKNCYTDVKIDIPKGIIGGIVGYGEPENCYVRGTINTTSSPGQIKGNSLDRIKNCYYPSERGKDKEATPLTDTQMKMSTAYTGFDFKNTWIIDPYSTYPYPQLRSCMQVRANSIKLLSAPEKLDYSTSDDGLDLTGGKIEIAYENGSNVEAEISDDMVDFEGFEEGEQEVKVSYLGHECSFTIQVEKGEAEISGLHDLTLSPGNTKYVDAQSDSDGEISYSSNNPKVAEVNGNGKITALAAGKAKITVTVEETDEYQEASETFFVTVKKGSQNITVRSSYEKKMGQTFSLNVKRLGTGKISYKSSNSKVANVDSYGRVTALNPGNATITVKVNETNQYKGGTKKVKVKVLFFLGKPQITGVYEVNDYTAIEVRWKKVTGASGYEIEWRYSAWYNDTVGYQTVDKIFSTSQLSYTYKPNPSMTDEFDVRVRAYTTTNGQKKYGNWCSWKHYSLF